MTYVARHRDEFANFIVRPRIRGISLKSLYSRIKVIFRKQSKLEKLDISDLEILAFYARHLKENVQA
jgi:hypothetical protein